MIVFTSNAHTEPDAPEKVSYGDQPTTAQLPPDNRDEYPDDLVPTGKPDRCD